MATKKRNRNQPATADELVGLSSVINDIAKNSKSMEKKLQKAFLEGDKLSNKLTKTLVAQKKKILQESMKAQKDLDKVNRDGTKTISEQKNERARLNAILKQNSANLGLIQKKLGENQSIWEKASKKIRDFGKEILETVSPINFLGDIFSKLKNKFLAMISPMKIFSTIWDTLVKGFKVWEGLQEDLAASAGKLQMSIGASASQFAEMRKRAAAVAPIFGKLTQEIAGIKISNEFIGELATKFRSVSKVTPQVAADMMRVSRGLGIGTDGAVELSRALEGIAPAIGTIDFGGDMMKFGDSIGMTAGTLTKDFLEAKSSVAEFGDQGVATFKRAALMANQFGFETKKLFDMTKGFDDFGEGSNKVNELNAVLGTTISSFELMMEQDPARRLEIIRNAIKDQGLEWSKMNKFQRQAIASSLNLQVDEAARVFENNMSLQDLEEQQRKAAEAQEKRQKTQMSNEQLMNQALTRTKEVFDGIERALTKLSQAFANLLKPVFGEVNTSITGIIDNITAWIESAKGNAEVQKIIQTVADAIGDVGSYIQESMPTWEELKEKGKALWETMQQGWDDIKKVYTWIRDSFIPKIEEIYTWIDKNVGVVKALGIAFGLMVGSKIISGIGSLVSVFGSLGSVLGGIGPLAGKALAGLGGLASSAAGAVGAAASSIGGVASSALAAIGSTAVGAAAAVVGTGAAAYYGTKTLLEATGADKALESFGASLAGPTLPEGMEAEYYDTSKTPKQVPQARDKELQKLQKEKVEAKKKEEEFRQKMVKTASGQTLEVIASDVVIDGKKLGRVLFEISQRG